MSRTWQQEYASASEQIAAEALTARMKFEPFNSSHEGYAVLAEELDELWDDVKANNIEHSIQEAIQVGAMALRYIADMRAKLADKSITAADTLPDVVLADIGKDHAKYANWSPAPGTNTGHGHVFLRPDGVRARCGGPALCSDCAIDLARLLK